ncbi:hypothetical protein ACFVXG_16470 [Kitasatospora sp. NPDC058162]|uniref:hypothetical protein n=1 Tax=Kitasatospora sp. NPDC058162 TaxID=3346362 RepID=UPI0036D950FB
MIRSFLRTSAGKFAVRVVLAAALAVPAAAFAASADPAAASDAAGQVRPKAVATLDDLTWGS